MKKMAELLIPHTYPKVDIKHEEEILFLKQSIINIDGYELVLCFSKSDCDAYYLESLQIQSYYSNFLPFNLVCNLGKEFLGVHNLCYIDFLKKNKKVYCWTIKTKNDKTLPPNEDFDVGNYEGFVFNIIRPNIIEFH